MLRIAGLPRPEYLRTVALERWTPGQGWSIDVLDGGPLPAAAPASGSTWCSRLESASATWAGTPYARSVQQTHALPTNELPDAGLVFDTLLRREAVRGPSPACALPARR